MRILMALALAFSADAPAQTGWLAPPATQQRLAAGEVVVQTATGNDSARLEGRVRAAVWIRAPAQAIWDAVTDCRQAVAFVPGLRSCRRVDRAPDGRWEEFEHEVRYAWYLPSVRYVFRADYDPPRRIDFHRVSGDLKEEAGSWRLTAAPVVAATQVEYELYVQPGFWIPQTLITRALRRDLPAALTALRERVESSADHAGRRTRADPAQPPAAR
jgi:polyketide cyclase/dehydrase/lipid transport protein